MRSVQLLTGFLDAASAIPDRWYVSIGEGSIGPVNLDLLVRGIEAGKVPLDCYVRNEAWTVWRPLSDVAMVSVACPAPAEAAAARHEAACAFALVDDDGPPTLRRVMRWEAPAMLEPPPCDSRPTLPRLTRSLQHQNA